MPHDGHVHTHMHSHDDHPHPHDHNQAHGTEHLHSHPHGAPGHTHVSDELQDWIDNFVTGFRAADDKTGFLRLARVPFEIDDVDGGPGLKLIDVSVEDSYQVATASPAFASTELVYHPYPGRMVRERTDMRFVYVSLQARRDILLAEMAGMIRT